MWTILGKIFVETGFKNLPKVQLITQSDYTGKGELRTAQSNRQ